MGEEFERSLGKPWMINYFKFIDVDPSEAQSIFQLLDVDDTNHLDPEEFLHGCMRLRGPAQALELAMLINESHHFYKRAEDYLRLIHESVSEVEKKRVTE